MIEREYPRFQPPVSRLYKLRMSSQITHQQIVVDERDTKPSVPRGQDSSHLLNEREAVKGCHSNNVEHHEQTTPQWVFTKGNELFLICILVSVDSCNLLLASVGQRTCVPLPVVSVVCNEQSGDGEIAGYSEKRYSIRSTEYRKIVCVAFVGDKFAVSGYPVKDSLRSQYVCPVNK
jgi:hypothetical protein